MKIGIYTRGANVSMGGVKEYITHMTTALIANKESDDKFYIINSDNTKLSFGEKVDYKTLRFNNRILSDFIEAPHSINSLDLDVVWFPKNVVPFGINPKTKIVVTVHDLAYYLPQYNAYPLADTLYMKTMIRSSVSRADVVISDSENTKNDMVKFLNCDPEKIHVVYLGTDKKFSQLHDQQILSQFQKKYSLPEKFILYTGNISPRKNLIRLIEAFKNIQNEIPHSLVLTGKKGWNNKNIYREIQDTERVQQIGYVDTHDMPALYSLASLYAYPSLYEGFGLPILEAQACGCPVLTSNVSSMPEVGRDSVYYIDPFSVDEISRGITTILYDTGLKDTLKEKGLKNVKDFTWDKSAKQLYSYLK